LTTGLGLAAAAGRLAEGTDDADLKAAMKICQAKLTRQPDRAGDLAWGVYESGRLPDDEFRWACSVWGRAGQSQRVIAACEARLRAAKPLDPVTSLELTAAYRAADRPQDARRAETRDVQLPVPPKPAPPADPFGGPGGGMF